MLSLLKHVSPSLVGVNPSSLVEIGEPLLRWQVYDYDQNQQNLCTNLELLIELQEKAQI